MARRTPTAGRGDDRGERCARLHEEAMDMIRDLVWGG